MPGSAPEREAAIRAAFATQKEWCDRSGAPFTGMLCGLIGERLDRSTEFGGRVLDWPEDADPIKDALPLRVCGGLHALVRGGGAPALAALYPPHPFPDEETLWEVLRPALGDPALLPWLDGPPQTNEVGRSALLMGGLLTLAAQFPHPVELLELGASAGLNLLPDRYGCNLGGRTVGDPASPVQLQPQWEGAPPPHANVTIARRRGVDLNPLDPRRDAERLLAYVWADQQERLARLEAALAIAAADSPRVDRGDAADWLDARLAEPPQPGMSRIVFHTVAFDYFPKETQAEVVRRLEETGAAATAEAPLAWLRFEVEPGQDAFALRLRTWPDGEDRLLALAHPHGSIIRWLADHA
ncbi:MAG TPA: DUF2332 domain-containing protein [Allosphingosinicella sp.]|jgi:hypothetical protein|nr:DUF2332 domain-containing protein [Allosphingosinicella sp.]